MCDISTFQNAWFGLILLRDMPDSTTLAAPSVITRARRSLHEALAGVGAKFPASVNVHLHEHDLLEALAMRIGWERDIFFRLVPTWAFEAVVADFLRATFPHLSHLRPGAWEICDTATHGKVQIANFAQYEHLHRLKLKAEADPDLMAALGGDYLIAPDVVVLRDAEPDEVLNQTAAIVDAASARLSPLRAANNAVRLRFLHASLSCKWTLRSDRAQNARSEALNLLRNRKGHAPHIVAVTAEPIPSRLASLALGMSDLDCVYHIALPELQAAVAECVDEERSDQGGTLQMLVGGRRLRDISDLPLDLAI